MLVSIRDAMVTAAGYPTLADGLRDLGLTRGEFALERDLTVSAPLGSAGSTLDLGSTEGLDAFQKQLSEAGLQVSAFLLANNFNAPDLAGEVDWVVDCIRLAHRFGASAVRIDSAMRDDEGWSLEQRVNRFAECLKEALDRTATTPVPLGIENHGRNGNNVEFLKGVCERCDSPLLGVTLDTANWYWYGFPLSRVYEIHREMAPLVKHTHVKNIRFPQEVREQQREIGWKYGEYASPVPDGDIDHQRTVAYLADHGYRGDLCVEDESLGRFTPEERKEVLRRDVRYVKQLARAHP